MPWTTTRPSLLIRLRDTDDHDSWLEFERRYGDLILRYSLQRGLQLADAEDVRQEVFISLARVLPSFEYSPARGRFRGYLGRIVHNAVTRNATRPHRARETLVEDEGVLADDGPVDEPDDVWEREWIHHHLRLAMQSIRQTVDPRTMDTFELFLAGDSTEEVVRKTGLSTAAARKVKQRMRERIRAIVSEQLIDEEGL